jgi:hypothetical protein
MSLHHHSEFALERLLAEREVSVSVCLPARDEAATIGEVLDPVLGLAEAGAVSPSRVR